MTDWSLFGEQTLLRFCSARGAVTEAEYRKLATLKRRMLTDFDPQDVEVGTRYFAQKFRVEAARALA